MSDVTLYHNLRCSKSRQTLALLKSKGIEPHIVEYLESRPNQAELKQLLTLLNLTPRQLLRTKEAAYKELGLNDCSLSDDKLIKAMVACPILIERPIVTSNGKAKIGRPPENVLEIL